MKTPAARAKGDRNGGGRAGLLLAVSGIVVSGTRSVVVAVVAGSAVQARWSRFGAASRTWRTLAAPILVAGTLALWMEDNRGGPRLLVWQDSLPLVRAHWTGPLASGVSAELERTKAESEAATRP